MAYPHLCQEKVHSKLSKLAKPVESLSVGVQALMKGYLVGEADWGFVWGGQDSWRLDIDERRLLALDLLS